MAQSNKPRKAYRPKLAPTPHRLFSGYNTTAAIEESLSKLIRREKLTIDIEGHVVYFHAPGVYQHLGAGLRSIAEYARIHNLRTNSTLQFDALQSVIQCLLFKQALDEEVVHRALSEIAAIRTVMSTASDQLSQDIRQIVKINNFMRLSQGEPDFPTQVVI